MLEMGLRSQEHNHTIQSIPASQEALPLQIKQACSAGISQGLYSEYKWVLCLTLSGQSRPPSLMQLTNSNGMVSKVQRVSAGRSLEQAL